MFRTGEHTERHATGDNQIVSFRIESRDEISIIFYLCWIVARLWPGFRNVFVDRTDYADRVPIGSRN
jgi:hypothetical protein